MISTEPWDQYGADYDFARFEGTPRIAFLATSPRCGSHYLGHLLRGSGLFGAPLEYFAEARLNDWKKQLGVTSYPAVFDYLFRYRTSPNGWFSVKAHWPQFAWFMRNNSDPRLKNIAVWIRLVREDVVAQAVSWARAESSGKWISFRDEANTPEYSFDSIHAALISLRTEKRAWQLFFSKMPREQQITLHYEALVANPSLAVTEILDLAGIERSRAGDPAFKWHPQPQRTVTNDIWIERFTDEYYRRYQRLPAG
jgi:LPS sulfotransferase NodH